MPPHLLRRTVASLLAAGSLSGCAAFRPGILMAGERDVAYGPDRRHRMDIYLPAKADGPRPVVFFIYGGSWASGDKATYSFVGEALSSRGFVTVIADYRLVPQVRFPGFIEDGARALAFVRANIARYGGSPHGVHLVGHSAGAYNAMMLTLDKSYLAAAKLPSSYILSTVGLSGPYDFLPFDIAVTKAAFGAEREPARTQPINFVRRDAPPIFLGTGSEDTIVLPRNSQRLADALRDAGDRHVSLKVYPGLGHADTAIALATLLQWRAPILNDITAFLSPTAKSLRGRENHANTE